MEILYNFDEQDAEDNYYDEECIEDFCPYCGEYWEECICEQ